ncbi:DUF1090 domain-containing protein [Salmonella enterica]|nr:DUF1090 domain-containing protein [Salmonella enterica]EDU2480403.1 DUF1090 domain-containing protein [Salmonella enterica subsp. enterica serovar Oranienburg]EJL0891868.1 DUF1090 domain-containing protein [Salmonella enterica]ELH4551505.1 DUF1090 domain-containing protein [Salmonella enterica]
MKYIKIIPPTTFILLFSIQSYAALPVGCAAKKQEVENQITYAREHNNTHQISGLEKAFREIEEHCTDPQLLKQRQLKITEKENKVTERQAELDKAKETGNPKKIAQKQKKLDRAREELQDAQSMLNK